MNEKMVGFCIEIHVIYFEQDRQLTSDVKASEVLFFDETGN